MKPKIRFKGFEGDWETPRFYKMIDRVSISGYSSYLPGVEYEDIVSGEGLLNKDVTKKECRKAGLLFENGDILFGKLRPYLKNILLADFKGVAIGDFWVLRAKKLYDNSFLYVLVNTDSFMRIANISSGSKMPRADWNLVASSSFSIPETKDEQEKIADYFKALDAHISASTSLLDSLKKIKAASLQAMFPQEGETIPRLRFNGFEEKWELLPLSTFAKKSTEKNTSMDYTITLTNSAEYGVINQRDFFDHDISNDEHINGYYVIHNDDFVYNPRVSASAPVGPINRNLLGYSGVMSPLYLVFKVEDINKDFLSFFFQTTLWHKYMKLEGNTGARFDRLAISDKQFFNMPIYVPKEEMEQQAIADYFTNLDSQITLHSHCLEKLKQIKSACLDNMFV